MPGEQPATTGQVVLVKKIVMKDGGAVGGRPAILFTIYNPLTAPVIVYGELIREIVFFDTDQSVRLHKSPISLTMIQRIA